MSLVVVVLLCACAIGVLAGGSLDRLGRLELRSRGLVVAALGVQLVGALAGGPAHAVGLLVSAALVLAFLSRNRSLAGAGLVVLGLLTNAAVVLANGAMPVSLAAAERAGAPVEQLLAGADPRHELAGEGTRLGLLGDVVPVPLPLRPEVVSPGDVLVAAGLAQLVVAAMLAGPRARRGRQRPRAAAPDRPPQGGAGA